ncbi:MAG: hypothetical protein GVY30_11300 [Chloroflexi bacterium]|jgi:pyruvate,water dikinase|nr:hypothetical protein [Chloroflexota bacterium]
MHQLLYPPLTTEHKKEHVPHVSRIGGKALGLYWLAIHGFPAPPTWTLDTSLFDVAIQKSGESQALVKLWDMIKELEGDWKSIHQRLQEIESDLTNVRTALQKTSQFNMMSEALSKLPTAQHHHWAVRSSATVEDNPNYSFAGQFYTKISVLRYAIWSAIRDVWASVFTKEVLNYCIQYKTPIPRMGVVLQPMSLVKAEDRAGVTFSHSPIPTMKGILIQATFGTGETVVTGRGGDIYSVHDGKVAVQAMPPDRIEVSGPEGKMLAMAPPDRLALTKEEARTLADLTARVAELWGEPVDIEFIWKANAPEPQLVQVRSATGNR